MFFGKIFHFFIYVLKPVEILSKFQVIWSNLDLIRIKKNTKTFERKTIDKHSEKP